MKHPIGKLWKTEVDESPWWLLEWPLATIRRHVLLAVDSTDSCGNHDDSSDTWRPHPELSALLQFLARSLNPEDECSLWLIGRKNPIIQRKPFTELNRSYPGDFAAALEQAIRPVRGGTWLKDTLEGMVREAVIYRADGMLPFLLVATDGEVFDVEALGGVILKERIGLARLGKREGPQIEWLRGHTAEIQPTEDGLKELLKVPARTISLVAPGRSESDARFFSRNGELLPTAMGSLWQIPSDARYLGMAFIGGDRPRPKLVYAVGDKETDVTEIEEKPLPHPVPAHLQRVINDLSGFELRWDRERLRQLAAALREATKKGEVVGVFNCPWCTHLNPVTTGKLEKSLFCGSCDALLLAKDKKTWNELNEQNITNTEAPGALKHTSWRWRIEDDGSVGVPCKTGDSSYSKACQVMEDENGSWLALDLEHCVF